MDKLIYELPAGLKASNLYKIFPPYREVAEGHGLMGVVLAREDGKLQCHICGQWFDKVSKHIGYHKITLQEYRRMFGLRQKDHLMSEKLRSRQRLNFHMDSECLIRARDNSRATHMKDKERMYAKKGLAVRQSKNGLAFLNEQGLCPDQINHRFDIVAAQLKNQPTLNDLRRLDSPVASKIVSEFGCFNQYIKYRGFKPNQLYSRKSDAEIIASLRNEFLKCGKINSKHLVNKCSYPTILKRFGSLKNACRAAGINPKTWTMIG